MKKNHSAALIASFLSLPLLLLSPFLLSGEELPIPSYNNVVIISLEHNPLDAVEIEYIKNRFNFGLYAWLSFSVTALQPSLPWHYDLNDAASGLQGFKDQVEALLAAAKAKNVRLHLVLCSGIARGLWVYREAKTEDIRNCSWYNDNRICADDQLQDPNFLDNYVFGTFSRYARKMRANLEAKAKAVAAFLRQKMEENPDVLIALSGWGEAEMNYNRINPTKNLQDYFCDYSPFAIMEFRDWIGHTGMYDDATGKYRGQGYPGGDKYKGAAGLARFNSDFGTNFTTWDLKYFNWSLSDDYDSNPVDNINNDPHRIPLSQYSPGNMMPTSGPNYIEGGFDPPRSMMTPSKFLDLWNLFRQTMVHNFVRDVAIWMNEAGIPPDRWFSHQIPADYLFGSNPATWPELYGRYYSSASPLWTADIRPFGAIGATIYDIKFPPEIFPGEFARTTKYAVPKIASMTDNWALMEFDAETYPVGLTVLESSPDLILEQYLNIYQHRVHLINFWRWWDETREHRIKGMNKEIALARFIEKIRDKARMKDLNYVFSPPRVVELTGKYFPETRTVELRLSGKIWQGEPWVWTDWGDFAYFEVFRGEAPSFPEDLGHLLLRTRNFILEDRGVDPSRKYYYKVRAVNSKGVAGPLSEELLFPRLALTIETTSGGTTSPPPGTYYFDPETPVTIEAIPEASYDFIGWSGDASGLVNPITVIMDSNKSIKANFKLIEVYPPLNFHGEKLVNRSLTQAEYVIILRWNPNPKNKDIVKYRIYKMEGENKTLLAEVGGDILEYMHRHVARERTYIYAIAAVNNKGLVGEPAIAVVK